MRVRDIETRVLACTLVMLATCAHEQTRSPEQLHGSYVTALANDDAKQAYTLLAPDVRAATTFAEFESRWNSNAEQRAAWLEDAQALDEAELVGARSARSAHAGGIVLRWAELDGRYYVVDGLPGRAQYSTPVQVTRALIAAMRASDFSAVREVADDAWEQALSADWQTRADAIESALREPGNIRVSADLRRAELAYAPGRALVLVQTPQGWRVHALE